MFPHCHHFDRYLTFCNSSRCVKHSVHSEHVQVFFPIQTKNGNSIVSPCPSLGLPPSNSPSNFSTLLSIFHPTSTRTSTNLCALATESPRKPIKGELTQPSPSTRPSSPS